MPQVDVDMMKTLGATRLQTIRHTFIPHVISKVWDDIIVLVAISWTYIIIAEMMNMSGGGLGALAYVASRQSRTDKIFAVLITIIVIGFLQDKILKGLDRIFFPHKYA
jgi:NitT/TauT family transport system permease protein